jgi:hypothetical protein
VRALLLGFLLACTHHHGAPGIASDAASETDAPADAPVDASLACLSAYGSTGTCMTTSACAAMPDRTAVTGCAMAAPIACCIDTPDVSDNPPTPPGEKLMSQAQVTPAMTTWAVAILHDPVTYPMFSTTTMIFGALSVLARVEWHPPDFQNAAVHRGVTLYVPM